MCQGVQGGCNKGEILYKAVVVPGQAEEGLDLGEGRGGRNFGNSLMKGRVRGDTIARNNVAQERNSVTDKFTFKGV